jgi:hypothetical protein
MEQKEVFQQHRLLTALSRKYPNRYVAMVGQKILAIGKDQFSVLKKAERQRKRKKETIGLFFLPGGKKHFYLLKNICVHSL